MATITVPGGRLHVALSRGEKVAALRGDIRVPIAAVRDVTVEADALGAATGLRAPGLAIPGRTTIGTWRGRGVTRFVAARRGVPAVRVALAGAGLDELIVSTPDADAVAGAVRAGAGLAGGERAGVA
ncbi:hypothetical protein [Miltoncostaea marina]|uniref:hypothetical protein n=1 Tax=Miltoncostaea marina TaxID=2843215 RepID=UPI001C3C5C09|nr:hypothetical protein [Miltoncostaea marina]